ncbi:MAG: helix-turn-helix transcriptional regulator [Rikenellaceae bacterium]|nr:helix-turn-helix transcriptional regulator [Rikenellaceae bacterium]
MDCQPVIKKYFFQGDEYLCSLELAMSLIGGKWKTMVVFHLKDGPLRSGELQRTLPHISNKMFTQTLRELEKSGLIERVIYPVVPQKVEYKLTPVGESVLPVVLGLAQWGIDISENKN